MAKLHLTYGPMNSSKTGTMIMNAYNYREVGKNAVILKPSIDSRDGTESIVKARAGQQSACTLFNPDDNIFYTVALMAGWTVDDVSWLKTALRRYDQGDDGYTRHQALELFGSRSKSRIHCVLIDEMQFLSELQANQLLDIVDYLDIPVLAFGLRNDFKGVIFPATAILMAQAEEIRETRGICWCGSKATHVLRIAEDGTVDTDGPQVKVGGNDSYISVCRYHHKAGLYKEQA